MKSQLTTMALLVFLGVLVSFFALPASTQTTREAYQSAPDHAEMMASLKEAVAVMVPTKGNSCRGVVRFSQHGGHVHIEAQIEGLEPDTKHAIHIHEYGDLTFSDGKSAGGHYNPEGHPHSLPPGSARHAGDLGNLEADGQGKAHYRRSVQNLTIAGLKNPIIGRGVIVHAKIDDGGQPTGNAGARVAMGVVGIAKPSE